jgi:thiamine biosynthesis lipoprotein
VENFVLRGARYLPLFLALCLVFTGCGRGRNIVRSEFLLDTYVTVTVSGDYDEDELYNVLREVSDDVDECYVKPFSELNELSDMFAKGEILRNTYGEEVDFHLGALTRLWRNSPYSPNTASPQEAADLKDPRLPSPEEIALALKDKQYADPGAIAKGYALDKTYAYLRETNAKSGYAIISSESSILLFGEKPDGEPFLTAIKDPANPGNYIGYIETGAVFISTSGNSERYTLIDGKRYGHIYDRETGYPAATDLAAVTVIVPASTPDGGIMSDFLSTLIFMRGTAGLDTFLGYDGFTFVAVDNTGKVYGNQELFPIK